MSCKDGFIHSYAYFEILSKKLCVHCGQEEHDWFWFIQASIQAVPDRGMVSCIEGLWKNIKKRPSDAYLWYTLGDLHEILENYKVAAMCFDKAKSLGCGVDVKHVLEQKIWFLIFLGFFLGFQKCLFFVRSKQQNIEQNVFDMVFTDGKYVREDI